MAKIRHQRYRVQKLGLRKRIVLSVLPCLLPVSVTAANSPSWLSGGFCGRPVRKLLDYAQNAKNYLSFSE